MQHQVPQHPHQRHSSQLTGPASQLRPAYFSPKSTSSAGLGPAISALLSGKHSSPPHGLLTSPTTPSLGARSTMGEKEAQAAVLAVVASQTLLKKLGNVFWDAFSGSSSPSSNPVPSSSQMSNWDVDKVRKVLEGRAVVRVVDVDPLVSTVIGSSGLPATNKTSTTTNVTMSSAVNNGTCCMNVADLLEESMRSLTLGCSRSHHNNIVGVKMNEGSK